MNDQPAPGSAASPCWADFMSVWKTLRRSVKIVRAWINQDAIAYLNLYCSDFTIENADYPRCYTINNGDKYAYYGARAHYTVVAVEFWNAGRGRGYTAWQAAVRAVRHKGRRSRSGVSRCWARPTFRR
jgi:hypothetical protein